MSKQPQISPVMRELSAYIAAALRKPLPPTIVEKTKHHILDTIAAMVSGSRLEPGKKAIAYVKTLGGVKEACVMGSNIVTTAGNAALANGMLAHADETDDSHAPSLTHPGCGIVPAALAMAERERRNGVALLRAVALGYDVGCRLTQSLNAYEFRNDGHSTHSFGPMFGAAAAAGALAGLRERQVRHLLSFTAQQASGISCWMRDGEHVEKAFDFGGMPARNGVAAATMVAHGFTGVDDVFAGERNFFEAYASEPDPAQLVEGLGERFEILSTNIKKWSVGSPAQSALDALTCLMESEKPVLDEIVAIRVHLPTRSARTVDNAPMPDVNVQHLMALLLVDGRLTFHSVHDHGRMKDAAVLAVRKKVELLPSQELMEARPRRQAIVEIALRDARRLSRRTVAVRGTASNPMTRDEVEAKALDLIAGPLGPKRARALMEACRAIERCGDMTAFRQYWEVPTAQE